MAKNRSGADVAREALEEEGGVAPASSVDDFLTEGTEEVVSVPDGSDERIEEAGGDTEAIEKLRAAEAEIERLNAELAQANVSGRAVRNEQTPFAGDLGGYKFRIRLSKATAEKIPHLREKYPDGCVVHAVDESEAIRWFLANNEEKPGSGKMCDPMRVRVTVECLDEKRNKVLQFAQRVAYVRQRLESGHSLNAADEAFLEQFRDQILK